MGLESNDYEVPICVEFRQVEEITRLNKQVQSLTQERDEALNAKEAWSYAFERKREELAALRAEVERIELRKRNEACENWGCLHSRVSTNCPTLKKWCGKAGK